MHRLTIALALLAACHASRKQRKPVDRTIRTIDWSNRVYTVRDVGAVAMRGGRATIGDAVLTLNPPEYADFDYDRMEDALVTGVLVKPGAEPIWTIDVYSLRHGAVVLIGSIDGRYARKVSLGSRSVIVERSWENIYVYAWEDGRLQQRYDDHYGDEND